MNRFFRILIIGCLCFSTGCASRIAAKNLNKGREALDLYHSDVDFLVEDLLRQIFELKETSRGADFNISVMEKSAIYPDSVEFKDIRRCLQEALDLLERQGDASPDEIENLSSRIMSTIEFVDSISSYDGPEVRLVLDDQISWQDLNRREVNEIRENFNKSKTNRFIADEYFDSVEEYHTRGVSAEEFQADFLEEVITYSQVFSSVGETEEEE